MLDIALNHGVHLEHACGGSCACTTCHVIVKAGDQNLSEMEDDEADRVERVFHPSAFIAQFRIGEAIGPRIAPRRAAKPGVAHATE